MKFLLSTILSVFIICNTSAQSLDSTIKYIWKNDVTNISAAIEIYGLQQKNSSFCVFYLNNVDTVFNNISDSLFGEFVNISVLKCPIIKVNFYNNQDTLPTKKIKMYAEEMSKFILADVQKRFPQIKTNNLIISGVDYFALVALSAAINEPLQINKTALFFNEQENAALLSSLTSADAKRLKGKLYFYINHQNDDDKFTDALTTNLALNSSIVLYRFDYYGDLISPNIFEEAYNWLLADGNNYIIRGVD